MAKTPKTAPVWDNTAANIKVTAIAPDIEHDPRKGHRSKKFIADLKKSIAEKGVLTALSIADLPEQIDGKDYRIVAGRGRLQACSELIADGVWPANKTIPVVIVADGAATDSEKRQMALAENLVREKMEDIDVYEAVRDILAAGGSMAEAARTLAITTTQVKQYDALGSVAPAIIDQWRARKIGESEVKAFTLGASHEAQIEVYERLKKANNLYQHAIRSAFGASYDVPLGIKIVGEKAYAAAGGQIRKDLFSDGIAISDQPLLDRLVEEAFSAKCKELTDDGWSWALNERQVTNAWQYVHAINLSTLTSETLVALRARKDELEAKDADDMTEEDQQEFDGIDDKIEQEIGRLTVEALTPEIKAGSGCLVKHDGSQFVVKYAMLAPQKSNSSQPIVNTETGQQTAKPTISAALMLRLTEQLTTAAAVAIRNDSDVAIRALVAGVGSYGPIKLRSDGLGARQNLGLASFSKTFAEVEPTLSAVCNVVADSLDMRIMNNTAKRSAHTQTLIEAIGRDAFMQAAVATFDADDYFGAASLERMKQAIDDINAARVAALGENVEQLAIPKGKKAERAAWAAERAREAGWLPPEMRFEAEVGNEIAIDAHYAEDGEDDEDETDDSQGDEESTTDEVAE